MPERRRSILGRRRGSRAAGWWRSEGEDEYCGVDGDGRGQDRCRYRYVGGAAARGAQRRQRRGPAERESGDSQQHDAAAAGLERVRPAVAGHSPRRVHRVLCRLGHAQPAVERADDADDESDGAAPEPLGLAKLITDHGEVSQGRVQHLLLQARVTSEYEPEDGS